MQKSEDENEIGLGQIFFWISVIGSNAFLINEIGFESIINRIRIQFVDNLGVMSVEFVVVKYASVDYPRLYYGVEMVICTLSPCVLLSCISVI